MDIQMPKMDGFKSTQTIRTDPEFKHVAKIPIVAVTAHVLAGYRERCLEAGMNDYLSKPIKIEELRQMISKYL
jgi:CheY-like chemotaxis protein